MSDGRTIVVTGASGALGTTVVQHLARSGTQVVGIVRQIPDVAPESDEAVTWEAADLLDAQGVTSAMQRIVDRTGGIDALVCLAGGFFGDTPLLETPPARLIEQFELNVMTTYHSAQAVIPYFVRSGTGAIVAVGSRPALQPTSGAVAYGIAKFGVVRLIEQIHLEYRQVGIRANCIVPSIIDTAANRAAMPDQDPGLWVTPTQLATVIRFLIDDEASAVSGAVIPVYART